MKSGLLFLLVALLGSSCREQQQVVAPTLTPVDVCPMGNMVTTSAEGYQIIQGSWQWVQSVLETRGSGRSVATPALIGQTRQFVFNADRTYQYLVNQKLLQTGTYTLRNFGNDPIVWINFKTAQQSETGGVLLTLCESGLIFLGGAADGGSNDFYARLP